MLKENESIFIINFAYKGVVGAVVGIYLILFALAFWNINSYNELLKIYDVVVKEHTVAKKDLAQINKELKVITTTLKLSNSLKSNKDLSYRILAQIASSVPNRLLLLSCKLQWKKPSHNYWHSRIIGDQDNY